MVAEVNRSWAVVAFVVPGKGVVSVHFSALYRGRSKRVKLFVRQRDGAAL